MATTAQIDLELRKVVKLYLEEFSGDGYSIGTFFAFAAQSLLSAPTESPIYLKREAEAYGHCVALAADQAWRVVETAKAMKRRPKKKKR
jgi:hypothetical protein